MDSYMNKFGLALTSFILSCVGFFFLLILMIVSGSNNDTAIGMIAIMDIFLNLLALIFGLISIRTSKGKGFAIAGIATSGSIFALVVLLLVIGLALD